MFVIKNGMIHQCNTEERYRAFIAAGWEPYNPPTIKKRSSTKEEK